MLIYYLVWFLVTILLFFEICIYRKKSSSPLKGGIIFLIWGVFVFLTGFKGNVGTDYLGYQRLYYESFDQEYIFSVGAIEPLYWLWMKLSSSLALPFVIFWLITAIVNISLKFYVIRYFSPFFSASILIYFVGLFFERDFDGIRQGISISLCYLACIQYISKGKALLAIGIVLCAGLVHYSALLFLLIPLLSKIQIKDELIFIAIAIGIIGTLLQWNVFNIVFSVIGHNNILYDKIFSYTISEKYSESVGLSIGIIFRIIILTIFIRCKTFFHLDEKTYNLLKNGFFLSVCFYLIFSNFDILSHRLAYGFREFQIFIIPFFILIAKDLKNKLLIGSLISLYSLFLLERLLDSQPIDVYSYKFIF